MIIVTRFNGHKFVVNADLIKLVEETPDTIITLRDDGKILVKESMTEIIDLVIDYARSVRVPLADFCGV